MKNANNSKEPTKFDTGSKKTQVPQKKRCQNRPFSAEGGGQIQIQDGDLGAKDVKSHRTEEEGHGD